MKTKIQCIKICVVEHKIKQCRVKFIALNANIRKEEMSQMSNLSSHLKILEKKKSTINPKQAEGREE